MRTDTEVKQKQKRDFLFNDSCDAVLCCAPSRTTNSRLVNDKFQSNRTEGGEQQQTNK